MTYQVTTTYQGITDAPGYPHQTTAAGFRDMLENNLNPSEFLAWVDSKNLTGWDDVKDDIAACFETASESFDESTQTYIQVKNWTSEDLYNTFRSFVPILLALYGDDSTLSESMKYCFKVSVDTADI